MRTSSARLLDHFDLLLLHFFGSLTLYKTFTEYSFLRWYLLRR